MINKYFNKKQLDLLSEAEEYFRQVKNGYKRNSPHTLDVQVYEALKSVNPNEPKPNYSCSKCIFELYRKCSKVYNESKEFYKNVKDIKENSAEPITAKPTKQPKPIRNGANRQKSKKRSV